MTTRRVAIFATTFKDEPVAEVPGAGRGEAILGELAAGPHAALVEFRCDRDSSRPMTAVELAGITAVIADLEHYTADVLSQAGIGGGGTLELVARYGVGIESVDIPAATRAGVLVTNTPGANTTPTAEWAVATLLDVAGRRQPQHAKAAAGQPKSGPPRMDVTGKTVGIVGTGAIGRTVSRLLSGFSPKFLAYDPYPNTEWTGSIGAEYVSLDRLLTESDFVTLHAATGERLIGRSEIDLMKPSCVLVNCARGILVDNRAVHQAVAQGRLYGYGLDEVWTEADLPLDGLNISVSPHVGSDTDSGKAGMQEMSALAVAAYLRGETPPHLLNPEAFDHR